jgi:hypothetical protein
MNIDRPRRVELTAADFAELRAILGIVYAPKTAKNNAEVKEAAAKIARKRKLPNQPD